MFCSLLRLRSLQPYGRDGLGTPSIGHISRSLRPFLVYYCDERLLVDQDGIHATAGVQMQGIVSAAAEAGNVDFLPELEESRRSF